METKSGYSRRDFLKVLGATGGLVATGCAEKLPEKIIPYVIQPDEVIPGVASWYAGSCFECGAGCGVLVRTREGRAVKVEGNPNHPVNRGGLCARGQSTLQALYDPDRIREPLERKAENGVLAPVSWEDGVGHAASALKKATADKKIVILTGSLTGSEKAFLNEFTSKVPNSEHVEFELLSSDVVDAAAEQCFGAGYRTLFDFAKAQTIVNFGADFLETWISPVAFARDWAARRRPESAESEEAAVGKMSLFLHVEPRLSLTAANADQWIKNTPGSELVVMAALLKTVVARGAGSQLNSGERSRISALAERFANSKELSQSGVTQATIDKMAEALLKSDGSLILAGGASTSGADAVNCAVLANVLNLVLGNIGKSVTIIKSDRPAGDFGGLRMQKLIAEMTAKKVGVLLVSGTNVAFTLPTASGFQEALKEVPTIIALDTHLDETSSRASVVLPLSSSLESWRDAEPLPGVFNLNQPSMQPVFATQGLIDSLIAIALKLDISFGKIKNSADYIRAQWKQRTGESGFDARWLKYVEQGGDWGVVKAAATPTLAEAATSIQRVGRPISADDILLVAYPSVNFFDGTPANRPWMQEVPDVMSNIVWGSWVEMHPETALKHGLSDGDSAHIRTANGAIDCPVFVTDFVHPQLIAIPIGQGHENYGRYATGVGVNPLTQLPGELLAGGVTFRTSVTKLEHGNWDDKMVKLQWENSQHGRELIRNKNLSELKHPAKGNHHEGAEIENAEDRPQMYKQMEHPLYQWGMTVDLAACTGCSACVVACYAENNIPVVGKDLCGQRRQMSWIRIDRYFDGPEGRPVDGFMPMMCQHCGNAPCEPVCPVYATYHNEEGLNTMVYNRCVGTRYCSNNCSYKVRRFNWFKYDWPEPATWQLNPDVTVREVGVMEKCTFCIQRIKEVENKAKDLGRPVRDGEIQPACASSCPTKAITFGNLLDKSSEVSVRAKNERGYKCLDEEINTQPAVTYLTRITNDQIAGKEV